jgi:hypothetical protein
VVGELEDDLQTCIITETFLQTGMSSRLNDWLLVENVNKRWCPIEVSAMLCYSTDGIKPL